MKDLIEFLRARLDADEQAAADAAYSSGGNDWVYRDFGIDEKGRREGALQLADEAPIDSTDLERAVNMDGHQMFHIARHDPARVLRDVEARRRILAMLIESHEQAELAARENRSADAAMYFGKMTALLDVAKADAQVYSDHDDYREKWRP